MENNSTAVINNEMKTLEDVIELIKEDKLVDSTIPYWLRDDEAKLNSNVFIAGRLIIDFIKRKFNIKDESKMKNKITYSRVTGTFRHNYKLYVFSISFNYNPNAIMKIKNILNTCDRNFYYKGDTVLEVPLSETMFDNIKLPVLKPKYVIGDTVCLNKTYIRSKGRWNDYIRSQKHIVTKITKVSIERFSHKFIYDIATFDNSDKDRWNKTQFYMSNLKLIKGGL